MTENETRLTFLFDQAMKLRDEDDLAAARVLLDQLLKQLEAPDLLLRGHVHMQLGYFAQLRGEPEQRASHFDQAVDALPNNDLASMGWFLSLFDLGRYREAFQEMVRLLRSRHSRLYEEMIDVPGFGDELPKNVVALMAEARRLVAARRKN